MRDNLDKWIKDAKEDTPDSGEYRRLNRVLVKERMITEVPGRKRRHRLLIFLVALLMMVSVSGKISQLGSNSFDSDKKVELNAMGDTVTRYYDQFGGGSTNLPDSFTEADVRGFKQSLAAGEGEGEMLRVTGLSYGGKTTWVKIMRREVNGKVIENGQVTDNPVSEILDNEVVFYQAHMKDLMGKIKTLPAQAEVTMVVDGIIVDFDIWTFDYPGYGKVIRYVGIPQEKQ